MTFSVPRMRGGKAIAKRFAGFGAVPLVGALAPLFLIPIASRVGGVDGWYSLSVGQAVGTFAGIAITFGWNTLGPALVAMSKDRQQKSGLWAESLRERLLLSAVILPVAGLIAWQLAVPGMEFFTVLMAVAFGLSGLTPNWYFIGNGDAKGMALYDMIPKLVATLLAALIVLLTNSLWSYPVLWIIASALGVVGAHIRVGSPRLLGVSTFAEIAAGLKSRLSVAGVDALGGVYISAPIPIAGATTDAAGAAGLSSADKFYRFGLIAITTVANTLQAWTLDPAATSPRKRQLTAIVVHIIVGLVGLLGMGVLGVQLTTLLVGEAVAPHAEAMWFYGGAFFAVSCSTPLIRNLLIPASKTSYVLAGTAVGAIGGVAAMILLGRLMGADGIALGFMMSEFVLLLLIVPPSIRHYRTLS